MLQQIISIATQAWNIAMKYYKKKYTTTIKWKDEKYTDYLTSADLEIDIFIREKIQKLTPEYDILTEENEHRPKTFNENVRIIDPIDGTKWFVEETDGFSIMIGLATNGIPTLWVIYYPSLDILLYAQKWEGAFCVSNWNTIRCSMSTKQKLKDATMYYFEGTNEKEEKDIMQLKNLIDMQAFNGSNHIHDLVLWKCEAAWWGRSSAPWWHRDLCAPSVIVSEAWWMYVNHHGDYINFKNLEKHNWRFAASNQMIFDKIGEIIFS